jgi:ATP-dependent Clp protease ATP-binding subunit ClpB
LAERGYDPVYGARPLKRAIQQWVQDPLALALLRGDFAEGDTVVADVRAGQIVFHRPGEPEIVDAEFRVV